MKVCAPMRHPATRDTPCTYLGGGSHLCPLPTYLCVCVCVCGGGGSSLPSSHLLLEPNARSRTRVQEAAVGLVGVGVHLGSTKFRRGPSRLPPSPTVMCTGPHVLTV